MSKTTNKFSPEVRQRAIRMVLDHERDYPSRWATVVSIAEKIGCSPPTLHEWVTKAEVDSGKRAEVPTEMAEKMKALESENRIEFSVQPLQEGAVHIWNWRAVETQRRAASPAAFAECVRFYPRVRAKSS